MVPQVIVTEENRKSEHMVAFEIRDGIARRYWKERWGYLFLALGLAFFAFLVFFLPDWHPHVLHILPPFHNWI